jgi:hypothetical protein
MLRFETYSYTCHSRVVNEREEVPFEVVMLKLQMYLKVSIKIRLNSLMEKTNICIKLMTHN